MRYLILAAALTGCVNYDTNLIGYGGSNSDRGGTIGARAEAYLHSDAGFDGGVAIDSSGVLRDTVDQFTTTPLILARFRPAEHLEPYIGGGPSIAYSGGQWDEWSLGADFRAGIAYRLGDVAMRPWWLVLEGRALYAKLDTLERSVAAGGGQKRIGYKPPPEPVGVQRIGVDPWTVHVLLGVSRSF